MGCCACGCKRFTKIHGSFGVDVDIGPGESERKQVLLASCNDCGLVYRMDVV